MKKTIASAFTLLTAGVMSCNNVQESVSPTYIAVTAGAKGSAASSGTDVTASPTTAPTAVLTATGHIATPVPSPTNNPVTDAGTVLVTSSWMIKYTVNGVEDFTYQNVPFQFNAAQYNIYWHTVTADPQKGRTPVGFWYTPRISQHVGSIQMAFCSIDKLFYPLAGIWYLNSASTENNVILDKAYGGVAQIRFVR